MLAVDTCFPPGLGYAAFADLLSTMLQPMHFDLQRVSVPDALWQTPDGSAQGERVNLLAALDAGAAENCNLTFTPIRFRPAMAGAFRRWRSAWRKTSCLDAAPRI